jgi:O-methyltransferase
MPGSSASDGGKLVNPIKLLRCAEPTPAVPVASGDHPSIRTVYDIFPDIDSHGNYRRPSDFPDIKDAHFLEVYEKFKKYTLLGVAKFYNIYRSIEYIARNDIDGDIVECGVFLGGSLAAAAEFANHFGIKGRTLWAFDSFEGFPDTGIEEINIHGGLTKFGQHAHFRATAEETFAMADAGTNRFEIAEGFVEDTLPGADIDGISLLRLDTDYYASTKLELEILYPRLSHGGVLIVDDYGEFEGARRATDEYMRSLKAPCLLHRVDHSARSGVKQRD